MGPEFHDDLRINLINVIEVMARVSDKEALKKNVYLKDVMHQLNIQEFILDYMLFSQTEKAKSSYYSKNIATSLLVKALKEKIRNRIPHF